MKIYFSDTLKLDIARYVAAGRVREANVEAGKITFTPKSVVVRGFTESMADFSARRAFGPFKTKELIDSLHRESAKIRSKAKAKHKAGK